MSWLFSFCMCSTIDLYSRFFLGSKKSNIFTCISFQTYFIYNSILVLNNLTYTNYIINLEYLYGYFLYDILNLFIYYPRDKNTLFIIHHIIAIIMLRSVFTMNVINYYYPTMLCLIAEIQNPIMNLKEFLIPFPVIKEYNKKLLFIMYLIFRIILFPVYSYYVIMYSLPEYNMYLISLSMLIYSMSCSWFIQMKNKFKIKFY